MWNKFEMCVCVSKIVRALLVYHMELKILAKAVISEEVFKYPGLDNTVINYDNQERHNSLKQTIIF